MFISVVRRPMILCSLLVMSTMCAQSKQKSLPEPAVTEQSKRWTVDRIVARVNGTNILQSDLKTPRIAKEGGAFTLDEAIIDELFFQRAAEMQMLPTSADIERQLVAFKMHNNLVDLSDSQFEEQLKQSGFTLKMYKGQLARLIAIENIKRAEISERVVVTAQNVQDYYDKNPEYTKEEYLLSVATISHDQAKESEQSLLNNSSLVWESLGWIAKKDLSKDFSSIVAVRKGHLSKPIEHDGEFQILKLVDKKEKRLKTLDERYGEIERKIQDERRESFLGRFEQELKEKADREKTIVYL